MKSLSGTREEQLLFSSTAVKLDVFDILMGKSYKQGVEIDASGQSTKPSSPGNYSKISKPSTQGNTQEPSTKRVNLYLHQA
jgi:hypothetical protein